MDYSELQADLRRYVKDQATHNKLNMSAEVLEVEDIQACIRSAVSDWNVSPPLGVAEITWADVESNGLDDDIWVIIMKGAACYAIDMYTARDIQNTIRYNAPGGASVEEYGKDGSWKAFRNILWGDYKDALLGYKKFQNVKTFWG